MPAIVASSHPTRRVLRRILLVLAAMLVPIVLAEVVLRVLDPFGAAEQVERERFAAAILERDGRGELRLRAGARGMLLGHTVEIGGHGLRNPAIAQPKPDGTFRILVIGDSVAFGWGVAEAEAFPRILERMLADAGLPPAAERVEVINAGVPGWGAPNELVFLREHGLALEPDLVLVTLINNDLTDVLQAIAPAVDPAPPFRLPKVLRSLYIGRAVERAIAIATGRTGVAEFFVALDLDPEAVARASQALCLAFDAMRDACGDVPFAVIDTVGDGAGWRLETLVDCLAAARIPRIEAYLPIAEYDERYAVAATDQHPNARGHRELAKHVFAWVRDHLR